MAHHFITLPTCDRTQCSALHSCEYLELIQPNCTRLNQLVMLIATIKLDTGVNLTGVNLQGATYKELTYKELTYKELTYKELTYKELTYKELTYKELTYEESTYQ